MSCAMPTILALKATEQFFLPV
uniref:Uncharacterized protein n=1 Tax=Arabidopsis thaliana TaxID=3702 RepID=Q0WT68_ARATH|nr:hypothetical protein [Arabidopsis thaliana]